MLGWTFLGIKTCTCPLGSQDHSIGVMKRKKSLPEVQDLVVVTKTQGSTQMTREEIGVLSAARREALRQQLDEIERYKKNPLLYLVNPSVRVGGGHAYLVPSRCTLYSCHTFAYVCPYATC